MPGRLAAFGWRLIPLKLALALTPRDANLGSVPGAIRCTISAAQRWITEKIAEDAAAADGGSVTASEPGSSKAAWPELVGTAGASAKATIEAEVPPPSPPLLLLPSRNDMASTVCRSAGGAVRTPTAAAAD